METTSSTSLKHSKVALGAFNVDVSLDDDGHVTIIVASTDGSNVVDITDEVGCSEAEVGFRLTTAKIEADYAASAPL